MVWFDKIKWTLTKPQSMPGIIQKALEEYKVPTLVNHFRKQYGSYKKNKLKKTKNVITIWSSNLTSSYIPKVIQIRDLNSYLYTHVYGNLIQNCQT